MFNAHDIKKNLQISLAITCISFTILFVQALLVHADHTLPLHLAAKPFSQTMCKGKGTKASIHIQVARHRNLILKKVPGQHVPKDPDEARQKDYVYFITLDHLTNGQVANGAIAFDARHGVIFQQTYTDGISRPVFIAQQPPRLRPLTNLALNTFLSIHPILNAAIDSCRPYPAKVMYETDDEILRIETGKHRYKNLVRQHNRHLTPEEFHIRHETGYTNGYIDPEAGKHSNISYHAMNPLNFYVPTTYP